MVERPSLALDPSNGYLYCAYLRYDTSQVAEWVLQCRRVDIRFHGQRQSWSVGTNVTRTRPATIPAPARTESFQREPTLAERVTDGYLHCLTRWIGMPEAILR